MFINILYFLITLYIILSWHFICWYFNIYFRFNPILHKYQWTNYKRI